ncbi:hypothetical protein SVIOM74S_00501 [Streptomyces violarus]
MTGALGSVSGGASGKPTVKAVSGWSGSGSCGWWLVTNRNPEVPSVRTAQRSVSRSCCPAGSRSGRTESMGAIRCPKSASSRCWSRSSWYEGRTWPYSPSGAWKS